jgi:hypothetical protein
MRRLRRVRPWTVLVAVLAFATPWGLGLEVLLAAGFGAAYKAIEAAFGQRIKERFERQPDLHLAVAHDGEVVDTVVKVLPPWPFDADRIVEHEIKRLREEAVGGENLARKGLSVMFSRYDPLARRPSDEDYAEAREKFAEQVDAYEQKLREWLAEYSKATQARACTFEVALSVISARSGAYAEDVKLTIDLPEGVTIVETSPTVSAPPEPPSYVAPRPRSLAEPWGVPFYRRGVDVGKLQRGRADFVRAEMPAFSPWQTTGGGRHVTMRLGNVHHDSTVEIGEHLLIRVPGAARHTITWTLRTKNGRRHATDSFDVVASAAEPRLPFTRLHGIEAFPDAPFVDGDGEVVKEARTTDPPREPPAPTESTDANDLSARMHEWSAHNEWLALGLGDVADREDDQGVVVRRVVDDDQLDRRELDAGDAA